MKTSKIFSGLGTAGSVVGAATANPFIVAGGLALSGVGNFLTRKEERQRMLKQKENMLDRINMLREATELEYSPLYGNEANTLYAFGGKVGTTVPARNKQNLASQAYQVVNAGNHESGSDVPVYKGGRPVGKVEGGEVIDGDVAFSARQGNFAKIAKTLLQRKGELEKKLTKTKTKPERNIIIKEIEEINHKLNQLEKEQDAVFNNQNQDMLSTSPGNMAQTPSSMVSPQMPVPPPPINPGVQPPQYKTGGKILPYMDNIASALTPYPKAKVPAYVPFIPTPTNVNAEPAKQSVNTAYDRTKASLAQGSSGPGYTAAVLAAQGQTQDALGKIEAQAATQKAQLQGQNNKALQAIVANNVGLFNQYQTDKLQRDLVKRTDDLTNIANVTGKVAYKDKVDRSLMLNMLLNAEVANNIADFDYIRDIIRENPDWARNLEKIVTSPAKKAQLRRIIEEETGNTINAAALKNLFSSWKVKSRPTASSAQSGFLGGMRGLSNQLSNTWMNTGLNYDPVTFR